jgi:hypothetical protein
MYQVVNCDLRPEIKEETSITDIMKKCWAKNPQDRPTASQVIELLRNIL